MSNTLPLPRLDALVHPYPHLPGIEGVKLPHPTQNLLPLHAGLPVREASICGAFLSSFHGFDVPPLCEPNAGEEQVHSVPTNTQQTFQLLNSVWLEPRFGAGGPVLGRVEVEA